MTWFDARWGIEVSDWRAQSQRKLMRRLAEWTAINVMRRGQEEVIQEKHAMNVTGKQSPRKELEK